MADHYILMTYYAKYLKEIRGVSDSTVKHYQGALNHISRYLVKKEKLKETVYEIQNIESLERIREYLYADPEFLALDKRGHQMYSAGLNNYFKFAEGVGFYNIHNYIQVMDIEMPAKEKYTYLSDAWRRSSIIKMQSIEAAGYRCEIDGMHETFTAKSTGRPYMEGHHALSMKYQNKFSKSLDVYANIICLCPICHRLLHYGIAVEKETVLDKIYFDRSKRLTACGIKISKEDFKKLAM